MPDPTPEDPRPELFGSLLVVVQHLTRRLDEALAPLGLTSRQWLLLAVLERWFGDRTRPIGDTRAPSLTEAASRYGSSRQNVKQVALGLERRGYLRLVTDPDDRRTTRLAVTDKVGQVFSAPEVAVRGDELLHAVFEGLDDEELDQLHRLVVAWLARVGHPLPPESSREPGQSGRTPTPPKEPIE